MFFLPSWSLWSLLAFAAFVRPREIVVARSSSTFVTTDGTSFVVNGSYFKFAGTNAYWLPTLNTDQDIWYTLGNISAIGVKVVRLWAFNDVDIVPTKGTWFQLVQNSTVSINVGANGLQKLDTVVQMAEQHGLYLILSLTNNWYPLPVLNSSEHAATGTNKSLPRNYLSNDYGGMDMYVRQFGLSTHDQFYTNPSVLNAFMNFTTQVVSRYVNSPSIFSWELANDPRCNSTIPASPSCTTETITEWHATVAAHIRSIDPNHIISAGTSGFLCFDCPKLYPLNTPPAPVTSPVPGNSKRNRVAPVTARQILRQRAESRRLARRAAKLAGTLREDGIRIRGRWVSTATRRQETQDVGPAYDGSYGVDSQDIMNIPDIGFGAFTLFPDQQSYGSDESSDTSSDSYTNTVNSGVNWIEVQAQSADLVGKPSVLSSFGLVTQDNAPDFVPFNSTTAPYAADASSTQATNQAARRRATTNSTYGVTDQQQISAYNTWANTGIDSGLSGIGQYQWGETNLTAEPGTSISPGVAGIAQDNTTTANSAGDDSQGISPNDGYSDVGDNGVQAFLQTIYQNIG